MQNNGATTRHGLAGQRTGKEVTLEALMFQVADLAGIPRTLGGGDHPVNKPKLHPDFPREEWRRKYWSEELGTYKCYFCDNPAYPGGPFEERDGYLWPVEPPRCLECDAELDKIEADGYDPWEGDD